MLCNTTSAICTCQEKKGPLRPAEPNGVEPGNTILASGSQRTSGEGPGEFSRLLDAFPNGDELVVLDAGKSNTQFLSFDGGYLSSFHIYGQTWAGFFLGTGESLLKGEFLSNPNKESSEDWVTVSEGKDPVAFTSLRLDPLPEEQGVRCSDFSSWSGGAALSRRHRPPCRISACGWPMRLKIS